MVTRRVPLMMEQAFRWYEDSEEPLWHAVDEHEILSWWLRESAPTSEPGSFAQSYPALAPYYPFANPAHMANWLHESYFNYWWP